MKTQSKKIGDNQIQRYFDFLILLKTGLAHPVKLNTSTINSKHKLSQITFPTLISEGFVSYEKRKYKWIYDGEITFKIAKDFCYAMRKNRWGNVEPIKEKIKPVQLGLELTPTETERLVEVNNTLLKNGAELMNELQNSDKRINKYVSIVSEMENEIRHLKIEQGHRAKLVKELRNANEMLANEKDKSEKYGSIITFFWGLFTIKTKQNV